eukprot:CAMPEP_0172517568 /NCGR_PEP_ID=MMETSP1066-20121228/286133_1 /TAXON_ID=671091 /ORGANISM="Coscinodiscus wailesii, Strain CCMP2513" /LENGTH=91 /DNA_ID=CAMNT_0013299633 /DNA_START=114 /DNA_END=386 /DNA_ORIENTATION=-
MNQNKETSAGPIMISGYLLKKKGRHAAFTKGWNRRFFTVENELLTWRKKEQSPEPPKCLPINTIIQVYKLRTFKKGPRIVIKTCTKLFCLK